MFEDEPLVPMLAEMIGKDGQPDAAEIVRADAGGAVVKGGADDDAVAEAAEALKEDGVAGDAGDFREDEGAAGDFEGEAGVREFHGGDAGDDAVSLNGDGFPGHEEAAELHAEVAVHGVVVNAEVGSFFLGALQLGGTEGLEFFGLLRDADGVEGAAEFLGEEGGADVVVAAVDGEDKDAAGGGAHGFKVIEIGDVPAHLPAEMHVPEAVEVSEGELEDDAVTAPPAFNGAEGRLQGGKIGEDGTALRAGEAIDGKRNGPDEDEAEGDGEDAEEFEENPGPKGAMQARIPPKRGLRIRLFGGFFGTHAGAEKRASPEPIRCLGPTHPSRCR